MTYALFRVLSTLTNFYQILIVIWCILTWIPTSGGIVDDIRRVLGSLVQPYLEIFRRLIPPIGGFDFSPVVAIVAINLIMRALAVILFH